MGQLSQAINIKNVLDFYEIENFVETGTGIGEVVSDISSIKSDLNVHTIEIESQLYDRNKINLSHLKNVNWHLGESIKVLPDIIEGLNGNTLFWFDAHFPGADFGLASYGDEKDINKRLPLKNELEIAKSNKDITNDVIVIDDLRIYEDGPFQFGNWSERSKYGSEGLIEVVEELFGETHYVIKSYNAQGFIILLPLTKDVEDESLDLVVGSLE
jgi:hypothetical protein|tara:strand:+ start:3166 stop:3807 length:642 start_codon:yes stop_codon:yes gene_type:complete